MTTADLLDRARAAGLTLWREGDRLKYRGPQLAIDAMLPQLRAHKPELMAALDNPAAQARQQQALAMLEAHPEARYAAVTDLDATPGFVLLTLAIRDRATVELLIPAAKWDGALFLDLLERHGATVH